MKIYIRRSDYSCSNTKFSNMVRKKFPDGTSITFGQYKYYRIVSCGNYRYDIYASNIIPDGYKYYILKNSKQTIHEVW